jgi:hypothetical protein
MKVHPGGTGSYNDATSCFEICHGEMSIIPRGNDASVPLGTGHSGQAVIYN